MSQTESLIQYLPARTISGHDMPWIPESPVKSWKPLRFFADGRGFVEMMRMSPGATMPLHRHTGEIHAFNLKGERLLCTGECIGPGDYVYEPPGNTDWWKVVGDVPLTVLVVVHGEDQYLRPKTPRPHLPGDLDPIHDRHRIVEDGDIRPGRRGEFQGLLAIGGLGHHCPAGARLEERTQTVPDDVVVVSDQDMGHRAPLFSNDPPA